MSGENLYGGAFAQCEKTGRDVIRNRDQLTRAVYVCRECRVKIMGLSPKERSAVRAEMKTKQMKIEGT